MTKHEYPATQEQVLEWLERTRQATADAHAARMARWEYLQSDEYYKSINERLLAETHANITPPWLEDGND